MDEDGVYIKTNRIWSGLAFLLQNPRTLQPNELGHYKATYDLGLPILSPLLESERRNELMESKYRHRAGGRPHITLGWNLFSDDFGKTKRGRYHKFEACFGNIMNLPRLVASLYNIRLESLVC